jgi:hypothetical protein
MEKSVFCQKTPSVKILDDNLDKLFLVGRPPFHAVLLLSRRSLDAGPDRSVS